MLKYYPNNRLEELRKTMKNLSHYRRSLGQDLNPRPPKCEAGVLTIQPQHSVTIFGVPANNLF
jgi:hypothetical protein